MNVSTIQIGLQDLKVLQQIPHGARVDVAKALGDLIISARIITGPAKGFAGSKLMCFASEALKFLDNSYIIPNTFFSQR